MTRYKAQDTRYNQMPTHKIQPASKSTYSGLIDLTSAFVPLFLVGWNLPDRRQG